MVTDALSVGVVKTGDPGRFRGLGGPRALGALCSVRDALAGCFLSCSEPEGVGADPQRLCRGDANQAPPFARALVKSPRYEPRPHLFI